MLSRDAARNLREGVYTDGELQGVILELAEVQARSRQELLSGPILSRRSCLQQQGFYTFTSRWERSTFIPLSVFAGLIAFFYIHSGYTTPVGLSCLTWRKGHPD